MGILGMRGAPMVGVSLTRLCGCDEPAHAGAYGVAAAGASAGAWLASR
jgi:hypothetical protein